MAYPLGHRPAGLRFDVRQDYPMPSKNMPPKEASPQAETPQQHEVKDKPHARTSFPSHSFEKCQVGFPEPEPKSKEASSSISQTQVEDIINSGKHVDEGMKKGLNQEIDNLKQRLNEDKKSGNIRFKSQPNIILPVETPKIKSTLEDKIDKVIDQLKTKEPNVQDSLTEKTISALKDLKQMDHEYHLPEEGLSKIIDQLRDFPGGTSHFDLIKENMPILHQQ